MGKKKVNKYYAIKEGKGVKNKIVRTWDECSKLVLGYNSVYKSFKTEQEAKEYLSNVDTEKVREQTKKAYEHKKNTKVINIRIPKDLYLEFMNKCEDMEMDVNTVINNMIKEWI